MHEKADTESAGAIVLTMMMMMIIRVGGSLTSICLNY